MSFLSRRNFIVSASALSSFGLFSGCSQAQDVGGFDEQLDRIGLAEAELYSLEIASAGRFGIAASNLATGYTMGLRADERFAMCSSFKWLLAALVLQRVQAGEEELSREIAFTQDDMVSHAPVTGPALSAGRLSVEALCRGTVQTSDNLAANLLLRTLGGPEGFTQMLRDNGEMTTRLDRWEPELNENRRGDPRDTTTPNAMVSLMGYYLFGGGLGEPYQSLLKDWMIGAETGLGRLRASIPSDWISGDKTGTSSNEQTNDVAFAYTSEAPNDPVLISSYLTVSDPMEADHLHAEIARIVMGALV